MSKIRQNLRQLNNLKSRLTLQVAMIIAVFFLLFCTVHYNLMSRYFTNSAESELVHVASLIKAFDLNDTDYFTDLAEIEARYNCYVEIYDSEDELIYTSRINDSMFDSEPGSELSAEILKPRIMRILSHREETATTYFEVRQEYYGTAQYIVYGEFYSNGYSVVLYDSLDVIDSNGETAEKFIIYIAFFLVIILICSLYIYLNSFIVPLSKINRITKSMARLNFSETCPSFRISDLRQLSGNINHLSDTLKTSLSELRDKNAQLEKDIERERRQELIRREFISNASHELKTPIAIIQGYAEGIKVGIGDENSVEEYSEIIMHEAEKMNSLVVRMLDVSKLEAGPQMMPVQFNIADTLAQYLKSFNMLLDENDISMTVDIDSSYIGYGDIQYLCVVLGNYVSNAISHAEGEKQIHISCCPVDGAYRVIVFNTGKSIADDDIDKIWLSFYRADKARSRDKGRFGLGLSIVSSIQNAHKQKYGVQNCTDGVEFWFDIKAG